MALTSFSNMVGRLGMLTGQLDAAGKKKKAAQAKIKADAQRDIRDYMESQRQFNLGMTKDYDLARFNQDQANRRALFGMEGTLGAAMIRAAASSNNTTDQLGLSDMGNLNSMISDSVLNAMTPDGQPLFPNDAFEGGDLKPLYQGPFSEITNMVRSQVLSGQVQDNPVAINKAINDALGLLSPNVTTSGMGIFDGDPAANVGFGGEMGSIIAGFRGKLQSMPQSERQAEIQRFRDALTNRGLSPNVVNQVIRIVSRGI